jgi:hypothetical protein
MFYLSVITSAFQDQSRIVPEIRCKGVERAVINVTGSPLFYLLWNLSAFQGKSFNLYQSQISGKNRSIALTKVKESEKNKNGLNFGPIDFRDEAVAMVF